SQIKILETQNKLQIAEERNLELLKEMKNCKSTEAKDSNKENFRWGHLIHLKNLVSFQILSSEKQTQQLQSLMDEKNILMKKLEQFKEQKKLNDQTIAAIEGFNFKKNVLNNDSLESKQYESGILADVEFELAKFCEELSSLKNTIEKLTEHIESKKQFNTFLDNEIDESAIEVRELKSKFEKEKLIVEEKSKNSQSFHSSILETEGNLEIQQNVKEKLSERVLNLKSTKVSLQVQMEKIKNSLISFENDQDAMSRVRTHLNDQFFNYKNDFEKYSKEISSITAKSHEINESIKSHNLTIKQFREAEINLEKHISRLEKGNNLLKEVLHKVQYDMTIQMTKLKSENVIADHTKLMRSVLVLQRCIRITKHKRIEGSRINQKHVAKICAMMNNLEELQQKEKYELNAEKKKLKKTLLSKEKGLETCSAQYEFIRASKNLVASLLQSAEAYKNEYKRKIKITEEEIKSLEILLNTRKMESQKEQVARFQVESASRNMKTELNRAQIRLKEINFRFLSLKMESQNMKRALNGALRNTKDKKKEIKLLENHLKVKQSEQENVNGHFNWLKDKYSNTKYRNRESDSKICNVDEVIAHIKKLIEEKRREIRLKNQKLESNVGIVDEINSIEKVQVKIKSAIKKIKDTGTLIPVGKPIDKSKDLEKSKQYEKQLDTRDSVEIDLMMKQIKVKNHLLESKKEEDSRKMDHDLVSLYNKHLKKENDLWEKEKILNSENQILSNRLIALEKEKNEIECRLSTLIKFKSNSKEKETDEAKLVEEKDLENVNKKEMIHSIKTKAKIRPNAYLINKKTLEQENKVDSIRPFDANFRPFMPFKSLKKKTI
ncbi:MAG: hypothetical protein MHPSP_000686, partial [Paramarteilia canceri]